MSDKERADQLENAMNWFLMSNAIYGAYGAYPTSTMTLDAAIVEIPPKLSESEKGVANYLAYQIIAGKLELEQCLAMFPRFTDAIKQTLSDNGIQV